MKKPRLYKPYLDIAFQTGYIDFRTELCRQAIERDEFVYISFFWRIFKWNGRIRLYRPGYDR